MTQPESGPVAAPEFPTGLTWLQGGPLKLAELCTLVDRMAKLEGRVDG